MIEAIAALGKSIGYSAASWFWLLEEPECQNH